MDKDNEKVPAKMFMLLAESAKGINTYSAFDVCGQQHLLEKISQEESREEERHRKEELTR